MCVHVNHAYSLTGKNLKNCGSQMMLKMKTREKGHCPASLGLPRQAAASEINPELSKHAESSDRLPTGHCQL